MTTATLKMALAALTDSHSKADDVARRLVITRTTLYAYINGDGSLKEVGQRLLDTEQPKGTRKTHKMA